MSGQQHKLAYAGEISVSDTFQTDSGLWEYYGSAYRDNGSVVLTKNISSQLGQLWLKQPLTIPMHVSFEYKIGGGKGPLGQGDGFVFMFNKEKVSKPKGGGYLGFEPGKGYGVELDSFDNYWDQSASHMALIKDSVGNHLISINDTRAKDNVWHLLEIDIQSNSVTAKIDGQQVLNWSGSIDTKFSRVGFSAATANAYNWHIIKNVRISGIDNHKIPQEIKQTLGQRPFNIECGDPVNVATGNYTDRITDIKIPTRSMPLEFTRFYNSRDGYAGPLGKGWHHNYDSFLTVNPDGTVSLSYPDGHVSVFTFSNGVYRAVDCFETLIREPNGNYVLTFKDQLKYIYDAQGRLIQITDKNENVFNLQYSDSVLAAVYEPTGRYLQFSYSDDNRLTQITDIAGRTADYSYDLNGYLISVKDLNGGITQYTYSNGLASVIDQNNHMSIKNIYDSDLRVIEQEDEKGNKTKYTYDPINRKNKITDPRGFITEVYYDDKFRVTKMVYPENKTEEFTYDNNYNRTSHKDKNGNTTTYTYDNMGNLLTKKDPDPLGYTTTFTYDSLNNPTQIIDAAGYITNFTYDPKGNLLSLSKGAGGQTATTSFTYNDFGQVSTITNANGKTASISYDQYGNKASETNPLGQTTSYIFDNLGRKLSQTDTRGNTWGYTYNAAGNLLTVTDPLGRVITNTYDANNNLTSTTDAKGKSTTFMYDGNNNLTKTTDPLGNSTNYAYDAGNNRKSITDTNGNTTAFEYDFLERLTSTTYPDGTSETMTLDGNGNIIAKTDRKGNTTQYEYDVLNRLTKVTDPMGGTISNQYDSLNNKTKVTDQRGNSMAFTYDHESRLLTITDPLNNSTSYTYDLVGNKLSFTNAKGATWNYVHDDASRLIKTTDPLGHDSLVDYDQAGNVVATTDANGKTTSFTYNALNKIESVTDALGNKTEYVYDENNNLVKVTNARGYATTFVYDELNRQVELKNPLGHSSRYSYDPVGNLARKIMADGSTIQYDYDSNNRLKEINYPNMSRVAFDYDNNGNRTYMHDSSGSTSYLYDNLNRLTSVTRSVYGNDYETQYAYDAASNLTGFTYPNGLLVTYGYDELNRMTSVTDAVYGMTISYDELGNKTQESLPNGITVNYQYDDNGRLLSMEHAKGSDILTKSEYTLDHVGNRLTKTNEQGKTIAYTYDDLYQLTRVQYPDNNVSEYAYDAVGNRISANGVNYAYDEANRLIQVGSTPYGYDLNGNLISVGDAVYYNYDYENRLILFDNGTNSFRYTYDGDGMRASQSVTGEVYGSTEYFYDVNAGLPRLIMEKGTGDNITNYLYGGSLYSLISPSGQFFHHADGLGSISVITDVYGSPVNRYEYDAFGIPLMAEEGIANPFRFTGEPYDPSGLTYLRARYYDPSIGRFLTQDTVFGEINTPLSQNLYAYCGNNPVVFVDPSGHIRICWRDVWEDTKEKANYAGKLANDLVTPDLNNPVDVFFFELEKSAPFPAAKAAGFAGIIGRKGATKAVNLIKGTEEATGQLHHILSNKTMKALNEHPTLKGVFEREDAAFKNRAKDADAHKGYQQWHRDVDNATVDWLQNNPNATSQQFKDFLNGLYQQPNISSKIPGVNIH